MNHGSRNRVGLLQALGSDKILDVDEEPILQTHFASRLTAMSLLSVQKGLKHRQLEHTSLKGRCNQQERAVKQHEDTIKTLAKLLHCVRTACALRAYCARRSRDTHPRIPVTLLVCTAKQQSPHENDETAFNLVLHCPYEQTTQPCKVRLLQVFRCPWLRSWRRR